MLKKALIVVTFATALALQGGPALCAGNIPGRLLDARGIPQPGIYTSCNVLGFNMYGCQAAFTLDDPDPAKAGGFYLISLPGGTYSQAFSEKDALPFLYRKGIPVPTTGDAPYAVVQYEPACCCFGTEPIDSPHAWYAQSFRATGENLVSVGLRVAEPASGDVEVAILDGDNPNAVQLGPTRTLAISSTSAQSACWHAGEVPTVPGQVYTVRFTLQGGGAFRPWRQTVRDFMRSESPDARTWADGSETRDPLAMTVCMDDAGLINTMCWPFSESTFSAQYAGQSFVAKGCSVLGVTWLKGYNSSRYKITVHDGIGIGSGGVQIGPAKFASPTYVPGRSAVTWAPGEVPTVPGQTYYVKLEPADGTYGAIYIARGGDVYPGGRAYWAGTPASFDYAIGIYEEKSPGSIDQPEVAVIDLRAESISSTSAMIRWTTSLDSDSTVDYGESTPYTSTAYSSALTTDHAVPISGLKPNTMYHLRAISRASGAREGVSRDMVFVTAADGANLLSDAGFESGALGAWTGYGAASITGPVAIGGIAPRTGGCALAAAVEAGVANGGAYQRVAAAPGNTYALSAWVYTSCQGDFYSKSDQTVTRIGIDPTGGTDPAGANIVWTPYTNSQDAWTNIALSAEAVSNHITVFLYGGNENAIALSAFCFDDVVLTGAASAGPTDASLAEALTAHPDGSQLRIAGVVCTATAAQAGACYVEAADRANALRVETGDAVDVGDTVTLTGTVQTSASGERYLAGAAVSSRTASAALKPICARTSGLGGSALGDYCAGVPGTLGPYNVGMLMRCVGQVTSTGPGCVYVGDGSLPGDGIKVDTASLGSVPGVGEIVGVTGIVQLEGTAPSATVLLTPRGEGDVDGF